MSINTFEELLDRVENYITKSDDLNKINDAYKYALKTQEGYKSTNGDDLIKHSINVAYILAELNVDYITIVASLIHESVITCGKTLDEVDELFGHEVRTIIDNLDKISRLKLNDDSESSSIYLRKILVGLSEDVRVIFIKLADRLYNLKTVYVTKDDLQKRKLLETKNVLIPIAHRLGINSIKSELEDIWLKYSKPEVYDDITAKLNNSRDELNALIDEMKESLKEIMVEHNIPFKIKGRVKSVYSIYEKLMKGRKYSDIYDILALRIIVDRESDCYLAVGLIHAKYRPIPKRFKDYIAMPKENMYQSLHTTVFGPEGYLFEIQLRTHEMDEIAEHGIASHWSYKEHGTIKAQNIMEQKLELFRSLIESNSSVSETEFNKAVETEFLSNYIYVFTPKGDVVELPDGSTPIDFAYRIHSEVGDTTTGAIVNGNIAPLDTVLQDNDIVEIKTTPKSTPNKEWLNIAKTSQAKSKIKAFFSKQDKDIYIEKGKELLERELKKQHLIYNDVFTSEKIASLLSKLKINDVDDVYFAIGSLRFTPNYIINLITEDKKTVQDVLINKILNKTANTKTNVYKNEIIVDGLDNIKVSLASCCNPILGDEIVGYATKGNGITIHKKTCPNINNVKDRLIEVSWNSETDKYYFVTLFIKVNKGDNPIVPIVTKSSIRNVIIESLNKIDNENDTDIELVIKVKNKTDLDMFIDDINSIKGILSVMR